MLIYNCGLFLLYQCKHDFLVILKQLSNTPSDLIAWVRFPLPAPLSKIVAPSENIDKSTVKVDFFVASKNEEEIELKLFTMFL